VARFKIVDKRIEQYGGGGLPGHLEREFRPWDHTSVLIGLGARAKPGNVSDLAIYGRALDEATGTLIGYYPEGSVNPDGSVNFSPEVEATDGNPPHRSVVTGLGLRASPGNIVGLEIWTLDINHGFPPIMVPPPHGSGPLERHFMIGEGPSEKTARLHYGNLCTGFSIRAAAGANVTSAWVEWGQVLHGAQASAEGVLSSVTIRSDSQRVELTIALSAGGPDQWYFNLEESLSTQMLLLTHARDALLQGKRVNLSGVLWDHEPAAENEAITIFGA